MVEDLIIGVDDSEEIKLEVFCELLDEMEEGRDIWEPLLSEELTNSEDSVVVDSKEDS